MTASFEGVAVRFIAFEESPIAFANDVCRPGRRQGQSGICIRHTTPQTGIMGSRLVDRWESGLATEVEGDVLDGSGLREIEHDVPG